MMFNLNKTIEVHCYTWRKINAEEFCIKEMKPHRPKWFRDMGKMTGTKWNLPKLNIKHCHGILELFKRSFYLPLWTDLYIINEMHDINAISKDSYLIVSKHFDKANSQAPTLSEKHRNLKIDAPWIFDCDKDINFYITGASWDYINNDLFYNFHLPPAILDFKYQSCLNTQWLFPIPFTKEQETCISFQAGDPLYYITPLTDKKVKFISHCITKTEFFDKFDSLDRTTSFWSNAYARGKKLMGK